MDARGATRGWTGSVVTRAHKSFVTRLPAEAEGFSSREVGVGAGTSKRCGWFRYFPLGVVSEVVYVVGKGDGGEGELESSGEPMRGSRDSSEDFVIVVRGEG